MPRTERACARRRFTIAIVRAALAALLTALALAPAAAAATPGPAAFAAPGLTSGPVLTGAGLAWTSSRGVLLTGQHGAVKVLAGPDVANWDGISDLSWFGARWWAEARPDGVFGGPIGGALRALPALRRCNPATPNPLSAADGVVYAVSGEHLFAAQPAACFTGRRSPQGRVLEVDLRSGRAHLLATLPGEPTDIAASGRYLAVALRPRAFSGRIPATPRRPGVRLVDSRTGAVLEDIAPPPSQQPLTGGAVSGIQVDEMGDVLVTAGCCGTSSGQLAHVARPLEKQLMRRAWWWAPPGSRIGRPITLGGTAVLAHRRVVSLSGDAQGRSVIELADLHTGASRTIVTFTGTLAPTGLTLDARRLAWSQASSVLASTSAGGLRTCETVALGPPEIASVELRGLPAGGVVLTGVPVPAQYANGPPCARVLASVAGG